MHLGLSALVFVALFGQNPTEISGSRTMMHFCRFAVEPQLLKYHLADRLESGVHVSPENGVGVGV